MAVELTGDFSEMLRVVLDRLESWGRAFLSWWNPVQKIEFRESPKGSFKVNEPLGAVVVKVSGRKGKGLKNRKVKISLNAVEGRGPLTGITEQLTDEDGIAQFAQLHITEAGNYEICAECQGHHCVGDTFTVYEPVEKIEFRAMPGNICGNPAYVKKITLVVVGKDGKYLPEKKVTVQLERLNTTGMWKKCEIIAEEKTDQQGFLDIREIEIEHTGTYRIVANCEEATCATKKFEVDPPGIKTNIHEVGVEYGSEEYYKIILDDFMMEGKVEDSLIIRKKVN